MFLNDLDIARNRVVVTDSMNARVGVIPLGEHGALPDPSKAFFMPLTGDFQVQVGSNAQRIAARGGWLVIVQSNTGFLFRLDPRTGDTKRIDTGGYLVTDGDGIPFRGRSCLHPKPGRLGEVLRVGEFLRHARLKGEIKPAAGTVDVPTTATITLGGLYVVNARFTTPPTADTEYWITRFPLKP